MSVSLVYDASIRNNGTPVLCWDAVKRGLGFGEDVRRYEPRGELPEHELYLYVDDGRDDVTWECPKPNAYYAVDTHLGYDYRLEKAKQFDHVYCAQKNGAARMRADGIKNAQWLPLACSPSANPDLAEICAHPARAQIEGSGGIDKQYDVVFVGYINQGAGPGSNNRLEYLDRIFEEFPNSWLTTNVFFEEMAMRYIRGRVGLNISIRDDLNMRFFEIMSTGTCLVTNRTVVGINDLGFEEGTHFLGYDGQDEMVQQIQWALNNPNEREAIAKAGHELVRQNHQYKHRMHKILDIAGVALPA